MPDLIVYNIAIPMTDNTTGIVHTIDKFDAWFHRTVEICGGGTQVGTSLLGLWFEQPGDPPIQDYSNWYKFGIAPEKVDVLRNHIKQTAREFGQICIYFEKAGEADFIYFKP